MRQRGPEHEGERPLTLWQLMGSILAAMFGVQTNARRQRDFARGKASQFIVIGIVFTALFVLLVWGIVKAVMRLAGA